MKILIPTMGTRGDIQPYIALATELNKSGFETVIATHPCWQSLINQYKVEFYPIGPDINIEYEAAAIRGRSKHWILSMIRTMKFMFNIIEGSSSEIMELCKQFDLIVASHSHIGAAEAEASGMPYVSVTFQPPVIPRKLEEKTRAGQLQDKLAGLFMNPMMVGPYNKLRKKLGLSKVHSFDELISPYLNVIPVSPLVYPPDKYWEDKHKVTGYWFTAEDEEYQPENSLVEFIESGEPPVIISLGAMSFESSKEKAKLAMLVNAITNTGMRAILQGFNKSVEDYNLPDNFLHIGSVPHSWLFPKSYCVIHHGGFGTTASALRAGVPSIVIPHVLDQFMWAGRIKELKAGPTPVSSKELSEEKLTEAINALKKDYTEFSRNSKLLGQKIAEENGLEKTVELIKGAIKEREHTL